MAKQIDYPRASLKNSLQLAKAVDDLGGSCSTEMAADKLNKKVSGAFTALVGSAARFGLISSKKGQLETSELYRDYKLAYSTDEANKAVASAFLRPPLFQHVFDRFEGRELPISHFEKLLIREFSVPESSSSRVAKYFLEGAKQCGLLGANHILEANPSDELIASEENTDAQIETSNNYAQEPKQAENKNQNMNHDVMDDDSSFSVRIKGPGMDSVIVINEEEDLLIVRAMLKKVEKRLSSIDQTVWGDES